MRRRLRLGGGRPSVELLVAELRTAQQVRMRAHRLAKRNRTRTPAAAAATGAAPSRCPHSSRMRAARCRRRGALAAGHPTQFTFTLGSWTWKQMRDYSDWRMKDTTALGRDRRTVRRWLGYATLEALAATAPPDAAAALRTLGYRLVTEPKVTPDLQQLLATVTEPDFRPPKPTAPPPEAEDWPEGK